MEKYTAHTSIESATQKIDRLDAELLLAFVLGQTRTWLCAHDTDQMTSVQRRRFETLVARREQSEPIAYLIGNTSFYARSFFTDKSALIPRPETEDAVTRALSHLQTHPHDWVVWDVGTGSGVIAISVKAQLPSVSVIASDLHKDALQLAKKNARRHTVRISWVQADLFDATIETKIRATRCSRLMIVANLPYLPISDKKTMMPDVKKYEPHQALFAKDDGMSLNKKLMRQLAEWKQPLPFIAIMEFDPPQSKQLLQKAKTLFPHARITILKDMYHRQRFLEVVSLQ